VLASTFGGGVGFVVGVFVIFVIAAAGRHPLWARVGWAVGGAMQWLVLRSQVSRAGWWVLASTVGWLVGFLVGGAVGHEDILVVFLFFITLWAVAGAITGIALIWLLRQPAREA